MCCVEKTAPQAWHFTVSGINGHPEEKEGQTQLPARGVGLVFGKRRDIPSLHHLAQWQGS
jgi:hypothetical protein